MEYFLYLGGPIKGNSYEQAIGWRKKVSEALRQFDIICLSPMRWGEHRISELEMKDGYNEDIMMNSKGAKARDIVKDIYNSSFCR